MRDSHTEWAKSDNKYHIAYIWKLIYGTNEPFHRKENMALKTRPVVAKGEEEGVGWIGSLELINANYCLWNGSAMRSCGELCLVTYDGEW